MPGKPIKYSIVIPVYNEEGSLKPLFTELLAVMTPINNSYEIVFVNDCSYDQSLSIMEGFKEEFPEVVRIVNLDKRCGQTFGLRKGLDATKGEIAVTLDADLQNDPADIPKMLKKCLDPLRDYRSRYFNSTP